MVILLTSGKFALGCTVMMDSSMMYAIGRLHCRFVGFIQAANLFRLPFSVQKRKTIAIRFCSSSSSERFPLFEFCKGMGSSKTIVSLGLVKGRSQSAQSDDPHASSPHLLRTLRGEFLIDNVADSVALFIILNSPAKPKSPSKFGF